MNKNYDFLPHELAHLNYLRDNAYECALFLKREDDSFPLEKPQEIALIGNGVRNTVIGGTGSGAMNVQYKENVEEAFINEGFTISTTDWLNQYDKLKETVKKEFIKQMKKEAREHHAIAASYAFGRAPEESEYEFPIFSNDHEVAIYVLSRNSGEGADRKLIKGDVYLTESEIRDILLLNRTYKKFLLVLNVGGMVDLTPVLEVRNILLLSQLGSLTGDILVNIVLGKQNPSGKLTDSWANIKDYPYIDTPLDPDENRYTESIYVGYRYFETKQMKPLCPFGFGLSYTNFEHKLLEISNVKDCISLKVKVTNKGKYPGKEVIQAYMSGDPTRPYVELVAYKKSKILDSKESEELTFNFKLSDFPTYNESKESYILNKGQYVIKLGNRSDELKDVLVINLKDEIIVKKVKNVFDKVDFKDLELTPMFSKVNSSVPSIDLDKDDFESEHVEYKGKYTVPVPEVVKNLPLKDLIYFTMGDYIPGIVGMVGQSCSSVIGGAGESCTKIITIPETVNMVDGPAGLRIVQEYVVNNKGAFAITDDSVVSEIKNYIPKIVMPLFSNEKNRKKKGSRVIQIATALPIATALAQSFNMEFVEGCGRLVKEESEMFGVNLWLAPALSIHRHILCGRNFE